MMSQSFSNSNMHWKRTAHSFEYGELFSPPKWYFIKYKVIWTSRSWLKVDSISWEHLKFVCVKDPAWIKYLKTLIKTEWPGWRVVRCTNSLLDSFLVYCISLLSQQIFKGDRKWCKIWYFVCICNPSLVLMTSAIISILQLSK